MYKKINHLLLISLSVLLLAGCKKEDIFNFKLPTGRLSGKVVYESSGQPADGMVVILKNTNNGAFHLVLTDVNGSFSVGRLSTGNYSVIPTNDSLYSPVDVFADVKDGSVTNVPDIKIKFTDLPVLTLNLAGVLDVTRTSLTLKTLVNDGHSTIITRGYSYLKTSDPRDPSLGTKKALSISLDPFDLTYYQIPITGLTANTEYKIRSYVIIPRGGITNGVENTVTIYSTNTLLVKTLP